MTNDSSLVGFVITKYYLNARTQNTYKKEQ